MASSDCAKWNESIRPIPNLKGLNSSAKNVLFNKTAEITTGCLQFKLFLISLWFNFEIFSTKDVSKDSYIRNHTSRVGKNILFKNLPFNDVNYCLLVLSVSYLSSQIAEFDVMYPGVNSRIPGNSRLECRA